MPDTRLLPFRKRLALDLSDVAVAGDIAPADAGASPIDVTIRTHFVASAELPNPPDDPLRRRDDPTAGLYRQFIAGPRADFEKVEPVLLEWLRASPERAEEFAEDPAAVIGKLPSVEPDVKARLARYFGPQTPRVMPRLAGLNVSEMTFDAVAVAPPVLPAASTKAGEDITADALVQVGFSHLVRAFAEKLLPPIRAAASEVVFPVGNVIGTARLLAERPGDPELELEPGGTLKMTIGFGITQLEVPLGVGPVTIVDLGAVTLQARLELTTTPLAGGANVDLKLSTNGLTISQPPNLATLPVNLVGPITAAFNTASARLVQLLTPYFNFPLPLQFPDGLCGIGARGVVAKLLPKGQAGTQDSLALAIALLETTDLAALDAGASSRVKDGQDGAIFLSNLTMVKVACCLLSQSAEFGGLPAESHEATEEEPFCRWEHVHGFRLGAETFDELAYFEIRAVDGGIDTDLQLKKSGTGWNMTVTITSELRLDLVNGALSARAVPKVVVDKHVALWVKVLSIIAIIGGIVLIVVGIWTGIAPLAIAGRWVLAVGLLLGAVGIIVTAIADAVMPELLTDPEQLIGLLPTGIQEGLGKLTFLNALDWDDLEFGGYLTLPGSPSLVAAADVVMQPGCAIDLDSGEIVTSADIGARMDADLLFHESNVLVADTRALASEPQPGVPSSGAGSHPSVMHFVPRSGIDFTAVGPLRGRRLEPLGASRLVLFGVRPYPSIGYSDLAQLGFPTSATQINIPGAAAPGSDPVVKTFAVRTSAGRLASCAVWTDHLHRATLRYRTFDTPVWLSIDANIYIQTFGKPGVTDQTMIMNGTFTAVPGPQWPTQLSTSYRWYWSGVELLGSGLLDSIGNRFTIVNDHCQIETVQGADLKGWLCAAASNSSGLETVACRNVNHLGRIPKPPDVPGGGFGGGFSGPGGAPGSGGPGGGFGGGLPGGGGPHL
jgi:hypothetical protein